MSATIINNNPREIIDIANLMNIDSKFDVDDYFEYSDIQSIKSSSEDEIVNQEKEDKIIEIK